MKSIPKIRASSFIAMLALMSGSAGAATWTYSSTSPTSNSGLTATATAFSAANNTTATITASTAYYGGGLGVTSQGESTGSPQHSLDNNGAIETVMISFSDGVNGITSADKVNLTGADFGWVYNGDSDFSVYAYTGANSAPTPLGLSYNNLTSNGWTLIGHYNSGGAGSKTFANAVYSSSWLIGAFNGLGVGTGLDSGDDYFKIASVSGTPGKKGVPEPGTLLLIGAGMFGLTRWSRRKAA